MSRPSRAQHAAQIYERQREIGKTVRPRLSHMCYCQVKSSGHVAGYDGCNAARGTTHIAPRCGDCGATNFVTLGSRTDRVARYRCDQCGSGDIMEDAKCKELLDPISIDQLLYDQKERL